MENPTDKKFGNEVDFGCVYRGYKGLCNAGKSK